MYFKKAGGRIFGVQLSAAEQRVLNNEVKKAIIEAERAYDIDRESSILLMLHEHFGFGKTRLHKAWKLMFESGRQLQQHYELAPEDSGWLCRQRLKELGVDLEEWYRHEGCIQG